MPIRFNFYEIEKLLKHFNMKQRSKKSKMYVGVGKDGVHRLTKFDFHHGSDTIHPKTAQTIATSLGFDSPQSMKDYINNKL